MGARTGEEYLKGLRATSREIWIGGERVENVVDHPEFTQAAHAMASWYDLQLEHPDELLIADPETGEQINVSHMIPKSKDDLKKRAVGLARISELSMGVMGRLPDYMNVTFAGFAGERRATGGARRPRTRRAAPTSSGLPEAAAPQRHLAHPHDRPPDIDRVKDDDFADNRCRCTRWARRRTRSSCGAARILATLAPSPTSRPSTPGTRCPLAPPSEYALSFPMRHGHARPDVPLP